MGEATVVKRFSQFGKIESSQFPKNSHKKKRGFGYMRYQNPESAASAILEMHQRVHFERKLTVEYAEHQRTPSPKRKRKAKNRAHSYRRDNFNYIQGTTRMPCSTVLDSVVDSAPPFFDPPRFQPRFPPIDMQPVIIPLNMQQSNLAVDSGWQPVYQEYEFQPVHSQEPRLT